MSEPDHKNPLEQDFPWHKHIPHSAWESAIEKSIREAMARGDFDNLSGQGKPLNLHRDPNTPQEWEMAFKLLQDAGFAPAWIELDKELRAARAALFAPLDTYLARLAREGRAAASSRYEAQLVSDFRVQATELNRRIDTFNLQAPSPRVHHVRIRIDDEIGKFCTAIEQRRAPKD